MIIFHKVHSVCLLTFFINPYKTYSFIVRIWGTCWVLDCGCPCPHLFFINSTIFTEKPLQEKRPSCVGEFHCLMRRGVSTGSDTPRHLHHLPHLHPITHTSLYRRTVPAIRYCIVRHIHWCALMQFIPLIHLHWCFLWEEQRLVNFRWSRFNQCDMEVKVVLVRVGQMLSMSFA